MVARLTYRGRSLASLRNPPQARDPPSGSPSGAPSGPSSALGASFTASATGTPLANATGSYTGLLGSPVSRSAGLHNPSGVYAYGSSPTWRLAFVAQAAAVATRELFTMPDAPSSDTPTAVAGLGGRSPVILAAMHTASSVSLLVATGSSEDSGAPARLHVLQSTAVCLVELATNMSLVQAAAVVHGSLFLVAAPHTAPLGTLRLWRILPDAVDAGLCGAPVPVMQVGAIIPRSRLSFCNGALTFVATTDTDDTPLLWSIDAGGAATSRILGAEPVANQLGALPGLACLNQSISAVALSSGSVIMLSVKEGAIAVASPQPDAPYVSPRALTAVGNRLCFVADVLTTPAVNHGALFCWTQAGGVVRVNGATVPVSVGWISPGSAGFIHVPCTLPGAARPHACVCDVSDSRWRAIVDVGTGAPVQQAYSSFVVAAGTAYFAGSLAATGSMALWQLL